MKKLCLINRGIIPAFALLFGLSLTAQDKNFIDQPYLETNARADTLVVPDRIYLGIEIKEADTRGKISVEELENRMAARLKALGINLDDQLMLSDLASSFRDYFLRKTDVHKSKAYSLMVYDALTAGKVIQELEGIGISNISLLKTEYAAKEDLKTILRQRAISRARKQAAAMLQPLGQTLGKVLYISDLNTDYSGIQGRATGIVVRGYAMENEQPLDVAFEKISAEGLVNVKFAID